MLQSKAILAPKESSDGTRISIMSRHTLNDGQTPDSRIQEDMYDIHEPKLAPPSKLIGKYYREEINFTEYKKAYLAYLDTIQQTIMDTLIEPWLSKDITLLCIEETPEYCHRKILLEYTQTLAENLLSTSIPTKIR